MTANQPGNSGRPETPDEGEQEPVVVRDRRRIDPDTGLRRSPAGDDVPAGESAPAGSGLAGEVNESMSGTLDEELAEVAAESGSGDSGADAAATSDMQRQVDELTADIKRVTAEYANYRKRVERDREAVVANAKAEVAGELLTVLDDLERADSHGDLTGPFKAVADKLTGALSDAGLQPFGQEGDEFDPSMHEAVQHQTSPEVAGPTVTAVLRRGYGFGERVLRPAMVAVTDHEPGEGDPAVVDSETTGQTAQEG